MNIAIQEFRNLAVSEMRAIGELVHYSLRTPYAEMAKGFTAMLVDEARHAYSLFEAVALLGGEISPLSAGTDQSSAELDQEVFSDVRLARFLGRIAHVESELPAVMSKTLALVEDPELHHGLQSRLSYVARDEDRHRLWAEKQLEMLLSGANRKEVKEALASVDQSCTKTEWRYAYCR